MEPIHIVILFALLVAFLLLRTIRRKYRALLTQMQTQYDDQRKELNNANFELLMHQRVLSKARLIIGPAKMDKIVEQTKEDLATDIKVVGKVEPACCGDTDG
jgi:hypothetical protein